MIPTLISRQQFSRSNALRFTARVVSLVQDGNGITGRSFSTVQTLPPVLPPPSPPQPQTPYKEKGMVGKVMSRYSIQGSQQRIRLAESLFQAATRQGADPYVWGW